jgi:uncharacterized repeat protein (TIGR03803 family)
MTSNGRECGKGGKMNELNWRKTLGATMKTATLAVGIVFLPLIMIAPPAEAQTFSVLYTFTGGADGDNPASALTADTSGNLYGTTAFGGNTTGICASGPGCGVVFEVGPTGSETVLYSFTGGADGAFPYESGLLRNATGYLVGATSGGGRFGGPCGTDGCGVVFKLDPAGKETVLHAFEGADGWSPNGSLIKDSQGNLYGVTANGGNLSGCFGYGCGVVFKLSPGSKETVLYAFTGGGDGWSPQGRLIRDSAGNLYGTTYLGGNVSGPCHVGSGYGCGVVFKVDPAGNESVLYAFSGGYDGGPPTPGLVMDSSGNLYGTTYYGGGAGNGVVFKIDPAGQETVLLAFQEDGASGSVPGAGLIRDAEGNLYGTTIYAGPGGGCGYVFRLSQAGTETVLKDFGDGLGGCNPNAMLLEYQGSLYGTTVAGGADGHGVVFKRLSSQPSLDHRPPPGQSRW